MRLMLVVLLLGCGTSAVPCQSTCDCTETSSDNHCVGEWVCNASKVCEYACKTTCSGTVFTCPANEDCNGTICSARKACSTK
jgi:hypothetical protein